MLPGCSVANSLHFTGRLAMFAIFHKDSAVGIKITRESAFIRKGTHGAPNMRPKCSNSRKQIKGSPHLLFCKSHDFGMLGTGNSMHAIQQLEQGE